MLFLTMGKMRHETLWSLWLKQAAGLVPADCLAAAICGAGMPAKYEDAVQACAATEPGTCHAVENDSDLTSNQSVGPGCLQGTRTLFRPVRPPSQVCVVLLLLTVILHLISLHGH